MSIPKLHLFLLTSFLAILAWSAYKPKSHVTWFLETTPALIGLFLVIYYYKRFTLTPMLYWLIWAHAIILVIGGHYTYERVPVGEWMKLIFPSERNNYDKIGHFVQGFVPAILAREIFLRKKVMRAGAWLTLFVISICLAGSAFYELIEWSSTMVLGAGADDFLGTQGYIWDTQSDMALALAGCVTALLLLSRTHDISLAELSKKQAKQ